MFVVGTLVHPDGLIVYVCAETVINGNNPMSIVNRIEEDSLFFIIMI